MAITLLVLLIDASLHSRSPAPERELAAGAWVDKVLPLISASSVEGQTVSSLWASGLRMPAQAVAQQIDSVAAGAYANYQAVVKLRPPAELDGPAGLLEACLLARSEAAAELKTALTGVLGAAAQVTSSTSLPASRRAAAGPGGATNATTTTTVAAAPAPPQSEVQAVQKAGNDIQVGDQAFQLFASTMPASVGVRIPASAWGADPSPYQPQQAQVFLTSLRNASAAGPVHQVQIYAVSTDPAPVPPASPSPGGVETIPDAKAMTLTIVLADTGNQDEHGLTVTASISPAGSGTASVRDFVDLSPGEAHTISGLGPLNPPKGQPVTLTVAVTGPAGAGAAALATSTLVFQMPAPPPPTTSTTVGGTPPTT